MKDIDEIRRQNLRQLQEERGGPLGGAEAAGMSVSQFTNLRDGAKDSKTGKRRGMRKETARKIEASAGKPEGWLDVDHEALAGGYKLSSGPELRLSLPWPFPSVPEHLVTVLSPRDRQALDVALLAAYQALTAKKGKKASIAEQVAEMKGLLSTEEALAKKPEKVK